MTLHDDPSDPMAGFVEVSETGADSRKSAPASSHGDSAGLPSHFAPRVAAYATGPMFTEVEISRVTPSHWRWRNARTVTVQTHDGHNYRALRVTSNVQGGKTVTPYFVGYWAVEFLGLPLTIGRES